MGPVADVVNVKWILNGPIGHAFVESDEDLAWLYSKLLRSSSSRNYSYFVYLREAVPPSFHFSSSHLIGDVVVVAPLGWVLSDGIHAHHSPPSLSSSPSSGAGPFPRGSHGWNNSLPEMQSIFLAMGPNFSHLPRTKLPPSTFSTSSTAKNNNLVPAFSSLQIYDLLSKILKINHPSPNNGTADEWAKLEPWVILDDDQNTLV